MIGVSKVVVPVNDQERALEFWTRLMGFEVFYDETYGDERWVEVRPPDGSPVLVLSLRPDDEPGSKVREELPQSPVFFACEDVQLTHRELTERGVCFPQPPVEMHFGWWTMFEDPDGTRYALVERNERKSL